MPDVEYREIPGIRDYHAGSDGLKEKVMEHTLTVKMFKCGTGFTAGCSCGRRFSRATGCNQSGLDYALANLRNNFNLHCESNGATLTSITPAQIGERMLSLA